jgi:hypothetical protein
LPQDGKKNYHLIKTPLSGQKKNHLATGLTSSAANSLENFSASPEDKFGPKVVFTF